MRIPRAELKGENIAGKYPSASVEEEWSWRGHIWMRWCGVIRRKTQEAKSEAVQRTQDEAKQSEEKKGVVTVTKENTVTVALKSRRPGYTLTHSLRYAPTIPS
jgi:hypothetical protein